MCLWALVHALCKYPGTKMKGCHHVANSNVWCVGFQPFSVLCSEVQHIYACKMCLIRLLMAKDIGLMEGAGPRAVSQVSRHVSLSFKAPRPLWFHFSFLSVLCFSLLFSCISWCGCAGYSCFPGATVCQPLDSPVTLSLGMLNSW